MCFSSPRSVVLRFIPALVAATAVQSSWSDVLESSETHYRLSQVAKSDSPPAAVWERLVHPERWWNPAHSYSGEAENLSLEPIAGGLWREDWDSGSVAHGRVLQVREGELLRMEAPFGPLQGLGAYVVWTITIAAEGSGSRVSFDEVASAPPGSALDQLAGAVDAVKTEAIDRLVRD